MIRMIGTIVQTGFRALRRDRAAFILSFVLPIAFFSIFAVVFSGMRNGGTPRVSVLVVDEDRSGMSQRLVRGLQQEPALNAVTRPESKKDEPILPDYTAVTAETAVRQGDAPAALIIPKGFGEQAIAFGPGGGGKTVRILHDSSDAIAAPMISGLLQKVALTAMPDAMAREGEKYFDQASGGLSPEQRKRIDASFAQMRAFTGQGAPSGSGAGGLIAVESRDVVGEKKQNPMISFYAAGIGVMFLLFTASGAGGSLLDESDSGALDRVLSSRVNMTTLLIGKTTFCTLLAASQLTLMFLWGAAVFHLDLFQHLPGFFVMTIATSFAVASFGMLLASMTHTRAQLGAVSTLIILTMSAVGGSMFPRFLMPETMKKAGYLTLNAWAIDGYTKVFWRDEPISHLGPQVCVLVGAGIVIFLIARRFARKWESV